LGGQDKALKGKKREQPLKGKKKDSCPTSEKKVIEKTRLPKNGTVEREGGV